MGYSNATEIIEWSHEKMKEMHDFIISRHWIAGVASILFHAIILVIGQVLFLKPAEFGVATGMGGISGGISVEVESEPEHVEAQVNRLENMETASTAPESAIQPVVPTSEETEIESVTPAQAQAAQIEKAVAAPKSSSHASRNAFSHPASVSSGAGGAITQARPMYLQNPPPAYPPEAKRRAQQGVVLLAVKISADGNPESAHVFRSSNYTLLDEAALHAVQQWRFAPATLAGTPIPSIAHVPIRFVLE